MYCFTVCTEGLRELVNLFETAHSVKNDELLLRPQTRVEKEFHDCTIIPALLLWHAVRVENELAVKQVTEVPSVFPPAMFSEVAEVREISSNHGSF